MSPVAVICTGTAAACVTLAAVHAGIWLRRRAELANLGFSLLALGVAGFTWAEFALMRSADGAAAGTALQGVHGAIVLIAIGIVLFVSFYFRTGRAWLACGALSVRLIVLVVSMLRPTSADFDVIDGVSPVSWLGEAVSIPVGRTSVWHWVGQVGLVLLAAFLIDGSLRLWRTGDALDRRRALSVGGATALLAFFGPAWAALIFAGLLRWPHIEFLFFLPAVAVMAWHLGDDVMRAAELTGQLQVSERAALEVSGRLLTAQEDERRRIARDLHDDVSQRLALLSVEVELLAAAPAAEASIRTRQIASSAREVASDVHRIAYELHPAKLDQLGLETTLRSWCRDLGAQAKVQIEFAAVGVPSDLPAETALCVYRIAQEALQNIVRHSGSHSARVRLWMEHFVLRLTVTDDGRGFDALRVSGGGLGLVSMRERVRSLGGTIDVRSRPGAGTTVEAAIPVRREAAR